MELILVVVISAGMAENSQNGVSRSLICSVLCNQIWTVSDINYYLLLLLLL